MILAPASRVLLTEVALPRRSRQRLRRMLPFAVEEKLAVEPDRVHVALGPRVAEGIYAVAVVDREWLAQWLQTLERAESIGIETLAVPLEPDSWTVVWREGGAFVRTGLASGAALDHAPTSPVLLQLALEESRKSAGAPRKLVVRAAHDRLPDLELWSAELGVPCEAGEPWDESKPQETSQIELLQGEFEPPGKTRALLPRLRPALYLLAAALVLQALGTAAHWGLLRHEKSRLQAEMRERFRVSFPQAQAIVEPALQMHRQLEALRHASGEARADDFLVLLGRSAAAMNLRVSAVSYEQSKLLFDVEMEGRPEAEALLQRLQASGSRVTLAAVNPKGKRIEARFAFASRSGA